jgi:hypothetical protein
LSDKTYQPVLVDAAREIAFKYVKDWVMVIAYDAGFDKTHCTTFARTAGDKSFVADLSEVCLRAIGICTEDATVHEDFRLVRASEAAEEIGNLKDEIDRLKAQLAQALSKPTVRHLDSTTTLPGPGRE